MSIWIDIPKKFKAILDADVPVQALVGTVRLGIPVKPVSLSSYPVIVLGRCELVSSEMRGTKDNDRITEWSCPVYLAINSTNAKIEDATAWDTLDALEAAVVKALLEHADFQNVGPYIEIELESTEPDEESEFPILGIMYRFTVRKINDFD